MWPRLVASKILKKRLGNNNFVADFPNEANLLELTVPPLNLKSLNNDVKETPNFKVFVSTWNVGGVTPTEDFDMKELLDSGNACDIYVFGFQEVVPLRAASVLGTEKSKISTKWNSLIREALNKTETNERIKQIKEENNFRCIISKQMVGILISVWIRTNLQPFVQNPSVSCVGCGIMGCLGNKGSVSVRFQLQETSFCFVCSHLASGGKEGDERYRNSNAAEILSRTIFPKGPSNDLPRKILDHE
ncbi:hypothetical protein RD792_011333 [Penstemon davidsonii]|uniref:Inositol polyphosphate-related phosphatase domain-containing protein n=1 Tax=Penstemon davidsonii TaxID=160366 RepID=A0ABR0D4A9_9LAMI|nr:hypothetical protein RD792_011333 [Penstemon davidsonii]